MLQTNCPAQNQKSLSWCAFFPNLASSSFTFLQVERSGENWLKAGLLPFAYTVKEHDSLSICFIIYALPKVGTGMTKITKSYPQKTN